MLSRVAQNIYWMARQIERAEDTARLINVNSNLLLDLPRNTTFGWLPLIFIVGAEKLFFEKDPNRLADQSNVVRFLISDRDHPSSIISSLAAARENLRTTRDTVPPEAWEQINGLYIYARDHVPSRRGRFEFLRRVIQGAQQINGLLAGAMSRTAAYDFVRLGRYLERADMTTRILDVRSANLLARAGQPVPMTPDAFDSGQTQTQTQTQVAPPEREQI
ncbi:MAG: alpha-E domain-containing protein, partial [Candidatus Competibacteraceae bacterium]